MRILSWACINRSINLKDADEHALLDDGCEFKVLHGNSKEGAGQKSGCEDGAGQEGCQELAQWCIQLIGARLHSAESATANGVGWAAEEGQEEMKPLPEHLQKYRETLLSADQKAQEEFDKAVLSLSGGALGVSLVFLKDVVGSKPIELPQLLMCAWAAWGFSTLSVLFSYHMSHLTIRTMIRQVDAGEAYKPGFGGTHAKITAWLNVIGAVLFFVGVMLITAFACVNLSTKGALNGNQASSTATPSSATSAATGSAPALAIESGNGRGQPGMGAAKPASTASN
jgi:hypothetical protein